MCAKGLSMCSFSRFVAAKFSKRFQNSSTNLTLSSSVRPFVNACMNSQLVHRRTRETARWANSCLHNVSSEKYKKGWICIIEIINDSKLIRNRSANQTDFSMVCLHILRHCPSSQPERAMARRKHTMRCIEIVKMGTVLTRFTFWIFWNTLNVPVNVEELPYITGN